MQRFRGGRKLGWLRLRWWFRDFLGLELSQAHLLGHELSLDPNPFLLLLLFEHQPPMLLLKLMELENTDRRLPHPVMVFLRSGERILVAELRVSLVGEEIREEASLRAGFDVTPPGGRRGTRHGLHVKQAGAIALARVGSARIAKNTKNSMGKMPALRRVSGGRG